MNVVLNWGITKKGKHYENLCRNEEDDFSSEDFDKDYSEYSFENASRY